MKHLAALIFVFSLLLSFHMQDSVAAPARVSVVKENTQQQQAITVKSTKTGEEGVLQHSLRMPRTSLTNSFNEGKKFISQENNTGFSKNSFLFSNISADKRQGNKTACPFYLVFRSILI